MKKPEFGPLKACRLSCVDGGEMLASLININMHKDIFSLSWMKLNETGKKGHLQFQRGVKCQCSPK